MKVSHETLFVMIAREYRQRQGDHMLLIQHSSSGGVTAILIYVDDIIVTKSENKNR